MIGQAQAAAALLCELKLTLAGGPGIDHFLESGNAAAAAASPPAAGAADSESARQWLQRRYRTTVTSTADRRSGRRHRDGDWAAH